ncbi:uncharacterized protein CMU_027090 [Cryptosporidium muris RN66]|uniref:Uncharacterized protein n=1 Tax=Cryptosporidium muris (strain RN66) TaxID=441375 RepID=B6ABE8_CRYMR|nr:uncharacterized protein CMU_027090 [Cryptosporidium muris RN66]EEA05700.1 hypothetical protein, conserved [Cryptosporidium muris RN66]|eukprot:XP_002140049.1 hypothetical protein [Cryptosporidium muris RN66]
MVGTQRRCLMCLDESDSKAEQRYRRAINLEKANKALDVAKRAERLRLLYKVRFEEDLRAFMLVHKDATTKTNIAKKETKGNINSFDEKPKLNINKKNLLIQSKNTDSGIPSWAWPASLRNTKKVKSNSLFYTLETKIPLSPTQQSGSNSFYKNMKITKENDRKNVEKIREDTKQSSNEIARKKNKQKKSRDLVNIAKIATHQSKINMGKHVPQRPTQKLTTSSNSLRLLHRKPFSWTKLKQYPDDIIQDSEEDVSATSKNLDMKDLLIPGQLEIQPASQLIKKSSNQFNYQMEYNSNFGIQPSISSVGPTELPQGTNKALTDTLKRTQKMQQILQILMDQKNLDIERDEVAPSLSPSLFNENDEVEILAMSLTSKNQS